MLSSQDDARGAAPLWPIMAQGMSSQEERAADSCTRMMLKLKLVVAEKQEAIALLLQLGVHMETPFVQKIIYWSDCACLFQPPSYVSN